MVGCGLQGANHACFWIVDAAANERAAIGQTEPLRLNVQQGACLHSHDLQALPDVGTHLVNLSLRLAQQVQPAVTGWEVCLRLCSPSCPYWTQQLIANSNGW